jgi:phosphoadenosine phosphosulfate reductase
MAPSLNATPAVSTEPAKLSLNEKQIAHINSHLQNLGSQEILQWSVVTLPGLFQTTAFGLTGLVTLDILSKLYPEQNPVDLIFVDTLYHFQETLDLVERVKVKYPQVRLHIYKPEGCETVEDFEAKYGKRLWERDETLYDYAVKVEPVERAYRELNVTAALTGRRRSQGGQRGTLPIVEVNEGGLLKINPLADWSFQQVLDYIKINEVPYNSLLDRGYRSVGDWHSTVPVKEGEDERAGRWQGKTKTECGIHETSRFAQYLKERAAAQANNDAKAY